VIRALQVAGIVGLLLALAVLAGAASCSTQGGSHELTRAQGDEILAELRDIHKLLVEQRAHPADGDPAAPAHVQIEDVAAYSFGSTSAPLTLVEFTDYQCPFCKRFHDQTWPELKRNYVDTGKVRYLVRDLPLQFHAEAMPSAIAAHCAGDQGQFWPVHEALFAIAEPLSAGAARKIALHLGVKVEQFDSCVQGAAVANAIKADTAEAERIGINGTPGFVLAQRSGGKLDGTVLLGAQPYQVFASRIDALLAAPPRP
jgi:protein-disulfide isomerase